MNPFPRRTVKSTPGKGSFFWFILPMRKSLQEMPSGRRNLQDIRTLLVAERGSQETRQLFYALKEEGMLIEQSEDQYDALSKLKSSANLGASWRYELMMIDAALSNINLSKIIDLAREVPHMREVEILVVNLPEVDQVTYEAMGVECLHAHATSKEIKQRLYRIFDVEQTLGATTMPEEIPVPRMPDDHLAWQDSQIEHFTEPGAKRAEDSQREQQHTKLVGRVLVVEDNPVNQAVVKKMLEKAGLSPVTSNDGVEAMEVLRDEQFDVVLMDCQMPRMDGYEATEAIRQKELSQGLMRTPVIAMTANAMAGDRERCLEVGMDDYLSKPVKPAMLENMLRQWLPMEEMISPDENASLEGSLNEAGEDAEVDVPSEGLLEIGGGHGGGTGMTSGGIIDRNVLEELYEIMEDDFVSVLESYLKSAPGLMLGIRDAVKAGDMDGLVKSAHPLKSSSANVGAMELSILARELEFKGRQGDANGLVSSYNQTAEIYRRSIAELKSIIDRGSIH
ncbi:MAG: response regulator [Candidatus Thiodiazotropha sp.]